MYSQYSFDHINTAILCQESKRKKREHRKINKESRGREGEEKRGDTFVLLISALKDTITFHGILSMFYTSPGPRVVALPRLPHVRAIF